jgi:hypothetical protein
MVAQKGKTSASGGNVTPEPAITQSNGEKPVNGGGPPGSGPSAASPVLSRAAIFVAIGVLVVYVVALWLLFEHRADGSWDRMVYLFGGFEAIVFAAVGAIFGTTVQRATVATAQVHAQQARADARAERNRADNAVALGASGSALATGIRSYAAGRLNSAPMSAGAAEARHGVGVRGEEPAPVDSDLSFLVQLANDLFPAK